ncbi:hypothetical protein K3H47_06435 [Aeromonas veronii]|uniref:hypothetical protein n=1 Tax=Aeromonas veronii TaxID=654 RepID=UPI001F2C52E6|nr:hypothetical protein [Aeromonas veronii]MCF5763590.1 hypothetical protein [Aeromonas veronii]
MGSRVVPGGRIVSHLGQRQPGSSPQSAKAVQYVKQNDAELLTILFVMILDWRFYWGNWIEMYSRSTMVVDILNAQGGGGGKA